MSATICQSIAKRCRARAKELAPSTLTIHGPDTSRTDDWNKLAEMFEAEAKSEQQRSAKK